MRLAHFIAVVLKLLLLEFELGIQFLVWLLSVIQV